MLINYKRKAQALVEIGILGTVVLLTLGAMCLFIARMNVDQYILMESFRRALKKSHDENKCIGYGMWDDRRMVDIQQPIIGNKNTHSGAGFAMWAIGDVTGSGESPEDALYVAINSPPAAMFFNEYQVQGGSGGIKTDYLTFTLETLEVSTSGHATSSVRASGVGETMHYEIGDSNHVYQGRGYGGARALGATN
ncbi:MAG: hypothetical protein JW867_05475 [Candidatus Omnitrophica bacterium]|nr:hypothetical protein [Candidatus Omnitrophota bacterium]